MLCWNLKNPNSTPIGEENPASEQEAILQAILKNSSDGIFIVELRWEEFWFVCANQTYLLMHAIADTDVTNKPISECLPSDISQIIQQNLTHCLQNQQSRTYQQPIETEIGSQLAIVTLSPIHINGKITQILGIAQDITEKQRNRAVAQLLQTITLGVAEAQDFDSALSIALQKICQVTGWNYAEAWVPSSDPGFIECTPACYSTSGSLDSFRNIRKQQKFSANSNLGEIWSAQPLKWMPSGLPQPIDSLLDTKIAAEADFQAGLSIPILASGKLIAVLVFFMFEPRLENKQISLVSAVGVQLGAVIHHKKYRNIFENAVAGIYQTSIQGRYHTANPMLARIYGYSSPDEMMVNLTDIGKQLYVKPNRRDEFQRLLQKQDVIYGFESEVYRKDGSTIWISESARAIRNDQGQLIGYEGTVEDITKRKEAEVELHNREALLQGVATAMHHLLTDSDHQGAIIKALASLGVVIGVDRVYIYETHPHPETGLSALSLRFEWVTNSIQPSINPANRQNLTPCSFGLTNWPSILEATHAITDFIGSLPQEERELLEREGLLSRLIVPIRVEGQLWGYLGFDDGSKLRRRWSEGQISMLMAIGESIGGALQRQKMEEMIRHEALHDRLTGLPNRTLLAEKLNMALHNARRRESMFALMFLDLDHFKIINDTLGHAVGDRLLQAVVKRLSHCLREGDTIARWGGDEFILLLPHIFRPKDAAAIAQRILESLQEKFDLDGHNVAIGSSIGIALYPSDDRDSDSLMKKADAALYRAKQEGRNNFQFWNSSV
ncbi:diguanylate kinase [Oscillatoriales cyanobacterium USR001]|nr:diguanylate kinase [Oscillatoriales cyanobacterium USR001]